MTCSIRSLAAQASQQAVCSARRSWIAEAGGAAELAILSLAAYTLPRSNQPPPGRSSGNALASTVVIG